MQTKTDRDHITENSFVYYRQTDDGREIAVVEQLFEEGLLTIGPALADYWTGGWRYGSVLNAIVAASVWNPAEEAAPLGYYQAL